jgi:hypothetical protein
MSETILAGRRLTRAGYVLEADSRYRLNAIVAAPDEFAPAAFPGWKLPLAELDAALVPAAGPDPGAARADRRPE